MLPPTLQEPVLAEIKRQKYSAKASSRLVLSQLDGQPHHILILGLGDEGRLSPFEQSQKLRRLGALIESTAQEYRCASTTLYTDSLSLDRRENLSALLEGIKLNRYSFDRYKSKNRDKIFSPVTLQLWPTRLKVSAGLLFANAVAEGVTLARDLVNTPALDCTPKSLAKTAQELGRSHGISTRVLEHPQLQRMGAGALLAVARGSSEPPCLITLKIKGRSSSSKSIALVGKGVTFDSGGLSIKSASGMETMKYDMSGAAAVLGAMASLAQVNPRVEVRGYIPASENMISGSAIHPGDVVRAMNGKSIEILNTDCEGRLLLADALHLAEREKPNAIVDLATLTGACRVALGLEYAAIFSDQDGLCQQLIRASEEAGERLWRLPLAPEYRALIQSPIADIKNTGGSYGGAITAALFLKEFVEKTPWAHIDIAGPAYSESEKGHIKKGGVGFGVGTLVRYVLGA